jgi:hypothetical protein
MSDCKECSHMAVCVLFRQQGWTTCVFHNKSCDSVAVKIATAKEILYEMEDRLEFSTLCSVDTEKVKGIISDLKKKYTEGEG